MMRRESSDPSQIGLHVATSLSFEQSGIWYNVAMAVVKNEVPLTEPSFPYSNCIYQPIRPRNPAHMCYQEI
jgi:hypothetical protein